MLQLLAVFGVVTAAFEESSRFEVTSPPELVAAFADGVVPGTPALFGEFAYSHSQSISGRLYYADPPDDLLGCTEFSNEDIAKWPLQGGGLIVMVDRGNCTFVQKVRHVQNGGATAAIILDDREERGGRLPYMADDNTGNTITIPSLLIHKDDGAVIKAEMDKLPEGQSVLVKLSWNLPNPDGRVEWDFWTSSDNPLAEQFKIAFAPVAESLGDKAYMTPHYQFIDGSLVQYSCHVDDPNGLARDCGNQCTNQGRYCNFDPDGEMDVGLSGAHVVRENVRQICLYKYLDAVKQHLKWWDYVVKYKENCGDATQWGQECSFQTMTELDLPDAAENVSNCIQMSGGYGEEDGVNSLIRNELDDAIDMNVFYYPTIYINNRPYRGSLSCNTKYSEKKFDRGQCSILEAMCMGYEDGTKPDTCISPPQCAIGVLVDDCQRCGGTCHDCSVDECGRCLENNSTDRHKSCEDCNGMPNGPAKEDVCGVCNGQGKDACGLCATAYRPWTTDESECPVSNNLVDHDADKALPNWAIGVIIAGAVVLVLLVIGVWCYVRNKEKEMRQDIDDLLKQYLPMEQDVNADAAVVHDDGSSIQL